MLALIYQPLPFVRAVLLTIGAIAAVTLYCLVHTSLAGAAESPMQGVLWASVYVAPFLLAFEAFKRVPRLLGRLVVVVAAIGVSLALHALVFELSNPLFEIVQRLPSAGLALMLALTGQMIAARVRRSTAATSFQGGVPLPVEEIDWVAAAGNYVELHAGERTMLHRAPLATVEAVLKPHGFVRIHRSRLVARRAIARVRPTDVVLHSGVSLKTGTRYRAELAAALG